MHLANAMIDAYVDWRDACAAAWDAYECWSCAGSADALLAFAAYQAALDQEERAASVYAVVVMQIAASR
jgi:hypothetical protein